MFDSFLPIVSSPLTFFLSWPLSLLVIHVIRQAFSFANILIMPLYQRPHTEVLIEANRYPLFAVPTTLPRSLSHVVSLQVNPSPIPL